MHNAEHPSRRAEYWAGTRAITPLLIGSMPFAIIFGALAVNSGLSPQAAAAMSAFVFAGSAQFVAVGMLATGAGAWVIILTTFIVNLRHVLYGASIAPHVRQLSQRWLVPFGFMMTDESFVVAIQRYNRQDDAPYRHWFHLGTSLSLYVNWQIFTWIGLWAGRAIPNPAAWGLDFAFPATFIGMLVPLINSRSIVACVVCAGVAALLFNGLPNQLGLVVAALSGVIAGVTAEKWFPTPTRNVEDPAIYHARQGANRP